MQQQANIIPVVGSRKPAQIADSLGAVHVTLAPEQMARLTALTDIEVGFPHDFLARESIRDILFGGTQHSLQNKRR
jgi:diketogulonate reductase-like aldo/keto reductase